MAPPKQGIAVITIAVTFTLLATIFTALRFRARSMTLTSYKADDYWLLAATVITIGASVPYVISGLEYGCLEGGECTDENNTLLNKAFFIVNVVYVVQIFCVKVSLLEFYKRTFHTKRFVHAVHAIMAFVAAWAISFLLAILLGIWPISANWNPAVMTRDINYLLMWVWLYAFDVLADIIILCLPLFVIRKLRISNRDKFALAGVFGLGAVAVVAGIAELVIMAKTYDYTLTSTAFGDNVYVWQCLEPCIGIICTCLPLLHPYFRRHAPEAVIGASRAGYGMLQPVEPVAKVYRSQKGWSMHMEEVQNYHDNVIE